MWWYTRLIPALGRGRQVSDIEANLFYRVCSKKATTTQINSVSKTTLNRKEREKGEKATITPVFG